MNDTKHQFARAMLSRTIRTTFKNTVKPDKKLTTFQQDLFWPIFKKRQDLRGMALPIFESMCAQYYMAPDITCGKLAIPGNEYGPPHLLKDYIENKKFEINNGLLKTTDASDGIDGEILAVKHHMDLLNLPEGVDLTQELSDFALTGLKKRPKYFKSFLRMFKNIEAQCTDVLMIRGTITDKLGDGTTKHVLYLYAFVEDQYMLSFTMGAIKGSPLRNNTESFISTFTPNGSRKLVRIPLSTLGKKSNVDLKATMIYPAAQATINHMCNNIQEDCYSLNNIRTLSGVI